ncbi:galactose mutarotase [Pontiellaceae bacterium B12227]|nr:galactose mutarotase [Pontiellaceae bacterium B12227]
MVKYIWIAGLISMAGLLWGCSSTGGVVVSDSDGFQLYTLKNKAGATVKLTNYGARITSVVVPDRDGKLADVVLGYDEVDDYINASKRPYFGATLGRSAGRISKGRFTIDGREYTLATNNGGNHLHGGMVGFDKVVWDAEIAGPHAVKMSHLSPDGEEGYPGNLQVTVIFTLTNANELRIDYHAVTDQTTLVNLSNHSYFNLKGEGMGDILEHELTILAKQIVPLTDNKVPSGQLLPVSGTPFDFTAVKPIGRDIEARHEQLVLGKGYDHHFVFDEQSASEPLRLAEVYEPVSGRVLEVRTTAPGMQLYTANFLDGSLTGKSGKPYVKWGALCLETQGYPDSVNHEAFPNSILSPGEVYESTTVYKFSVR